MMVGRECGVRSGRHDLSTHSVSDFTYVVMVTGCSKQLFFTTCWNMKCHKKIITDKMVN